MSGGTYAQFERRLDQLAGQEAAEKAWKVPQVLIQTVDSRGLPVFEDLCTGELVAYGELPEPECCPVVAVAAMRAEAVANAPDEAGEADADEVVEWTF